MMASATVDLPQPLSPTRPKASRGRTAKLRPGITLASPARRKNEIRAFSKARIGVAVDAAAGSVTPSLPSMQQPFAGHPTSLFGRANQLRPQHSQTFFSFSEQCYRWDRAQVNRA